MTMTQILTRVVASSWKNFTEEEHGELVSIPLTSAVSALITTTLPDGMEDEDRIARSLHKAGVIRNRQLPKLTQDKEGRLVFQWVNDTHKPSVDLFKADEWRIGQHKIGLAKIGSVDQRDVLRNIPETDGAVVRAAREYFIDTICTDEIQNYPAEGVLAVRRRKFPESDLRPLIECVPEVMTLLVTGQIEICEKRWKEAERLLHDVCRAVQFNGASTWFEEEDAIALFLQDPVSWCKKAAELELDRGDGQKISVESRLVTLAFHARQSWAGTFVDRPRGVEHEKEEYTSTMLALFLKSDLLDKYFKRDPLQFYIVLPQQHTSCIQEAEVLKKFAGFEMPQLCRVEDPNAPAPVDVVEEVVEDDTAKTSGTSKPLGTSDPVASEKKKYPKQPAKARGETVLTDTGLTPSPTR